ncbi:MAG: hypothetical protein KDC98_16720 [Planctomycetes bacterium]|nr:hypothetical protein [Planctomycetota bacterium]
MRAVLSSLLLPLFTTALVAQTAITMVAPSPISILTSEAGGASTFDGIPANHTIGTYPNSVSMSTSQYPGGKSFFAATIIYPTMGYNQGIGFNFFERASCRGVPGDISGSSSSAAQAGATLGDHTVLATFSNAPGTVGTIQISYRNNPGTGGTVHAKLDIDNDGTFEFDQAQGANTSFPYTMGSSGQVTVRVVNECSVDGVNLNTYNYAWTEIWVGFMPDITATCNITSYGQGCGGVTATGSEVVAGTSRTLTVLATGCFPNDPVIVATGSQQIRLPLLGGCELLSNAEGVALIGADGSGAASTSWVIPHSAIGTTYIQMLPITLQGNALVLAASNGVEVDCFH